MQFDKNARDDANNQVRKNQGTMAPLADGWYDVDFTSCRWFEGERFSRMSLGFRVNKGFNIGKRFFANITFGLKVPGEEVTTVDSQLVKLTAISQFLGLNETFEDPNAWAEALHARAGSQESYHLRVQVKFFSTAYVAEAYNLIKVAKA